MMPEIIHNQANLFVNIVPAQSAQISILAYSDGNLRLTAPLAPNLNDKGTAFAGSISSPLVLTGWALITLRLQEAGIQADVAVSKSETNYQRPVRADMITETRLESIAPLIQALRTNRRGRIQIEVILKSQGTLCATLAAHYVAFPASQSQSGASASRRLLADK